MSKLSTRSTSDQRGLDQLLVHLVGEVRLQAAAVEVELAGAGHQAHPDDGLFAAADGLDRALDDEGVLPRGRCGFRRRLRGLSGVVGDHFFGWSRLLPVSVITGSPA